MLDKPPISILMEVLIGPKRGIKFITDIHAEAPCMRTAFGAGIMRSRCRYGGMEVNEKAPKYGSSLSLNVVSRLAGTLVGSSRFESIHLISNVR